MANMQREQSGNIRTILVVDDHLDTLNMMQIHLTSRGHQVEIAVNGYDALDKLGGQRYDLIITDINMPGMCGNELCRAVAQALADQAPPIVAMSSEPWLASEKFSAVLTKPFRLREINALIEQMEHANGGQLVNLASRRSAS